jgi:hypothetical protein
MEICMQPLDLTPLRWFAAQGCKFVAVHPASKRPVHRGWPDTPLDLREALAHVRQGGNIGLLLGLPSHNLICLDIDHDFSLVCALLPHLAHVRITRTDAPERGKLLFRLDTSAPIQNRAWAFSNATPPTIELLGNRRQAVIPPSVHPSGLPYDLQPLYGILPTCSPPLLASAWELLTAETFAWYSQAQPFPEPKPKHHLIEQYRIPTVPSISIVAMRTQILQRFHSALAVFQHFGRAEKRRRMTRDEIRLLGNGGLIVGAPESVVRWRWYCFREGVGGDIVDAVGYCIVGPQWERRNPRHWQTLSHASLSSLF